MSQLLKHLVAVGIAVPLGVGGYHLVTTALNREGGPGSGVAGAADRSFVRAPYRLGALPVLERDIYWLESRYVERHRLVPQEMFEGALNRVEREVAEVMVEHDLVGKRIHISIGEHSSTLSTQPLNNLQDLSARLREVAVLLDRHLDPEVDRREVEYGLINGALGSLDPHTLLMPPAAAEDMNVDNKGEFGGLGIEIIDRDGQLIIKQPIDDTPASRAGLKAQDHIVRIEDESTINMDLTDAVGKLRGKPGDPVMIMVMRKGFSEPRAFTIIRDIIKVNPVEGELLEGNVGYVRIKQFNMRASKDLADLISRLQREAGGPLKGLVLDLRNNPGGYLSEAVDVADHFLDEGSIVITVDGGTGRREEQKAKRAPGNEDYPIAVLVNGNSASASEIVAGALKNRDRAVIIGERTFGKGSVQNLYDHDDGSRLKLTVARYLTPGDRNIQAVGVAADIQLRPAVIRAADPEAKETEPIASLYFREWIDREEALENVLRADGPLDAEPAFDLRFLRATDDDDPDPSARLDWEVLFARDVLVSAEGSRRPDVLSSAVSIVAQRRAQEEALIQQAFSRINIDWQAGERTASPSVEVKIEAGSEGALHAGQADQVKLIATNTGSEPVHRLSVLTRSENPYLDHREVYFGQLAPGQSAEGSFRVQVVHGYPAEQVPVQVELRSPDSPSLAHIDVPVRTEGRALPVLAYDIQLLDDGSAGSRGNGDGLPQAGERIALSILVKNQGEGATADAFARLRNRAGKGLDIDSGSLRPGAVVADDSPACKADEDACPRSLLAGQEWSGHFLFELRELPAEGSWKLELQVGDNRAYDYAAVQRAGFSEYFQQVETILLSPDQALPKGSRAPPVIQLSRAPGVHSDDARVVLSGMVTDDTAVRDVMVFHGDDKVFYQGGRDGSPGTPFTVDRNLSPGANLFVVLARDVDGFTSTRSLTVWHPEPTVQALRP